jgi:hypothetical protein
MSFYAYIHCKPDGTPFYVGKGGEPRVKRVLRSHNKKHESIVQEFGRGGILVGKLECSSENIAYDLERGLIKRLRKMGIDIVNLTEGGGGCGGFRMPDHAKKKISKALSGRKFSDSHIENLTKSLRGRKLPPISENHKASIGASNSAKKIGNKNTFGRIWITNGSKNRMANPNDGIPDGWRRGMTMVSKDVG